MFRHNEVAPDVLKEVCSLFKIRPVFSLDGILNALDESHLDQERLSEFAEFLDVEGDHVSILREFLIVVHRLGDYRVLLNHVVDQMIYRVNRASFVRRDLACLNGWPEEPAQIVLPIQWSFSPVPITLEAPRRKTTKLHDIREHVRIRMGEVDDKNDLVNELSKQFGIGHGTSRIYVGKFIREILQE